MLGYLEPTLAIICACIPTLRPIFKKFFNSLPSINRSPEDTRSAWTVPFVMLFTGYSQIQGSAQSQFSRSFHFNRGKEERITRSHDLRDSLQISQNEKVDTFSKLGTGNTLLTHDTHGLKRSNEIWDIPGSDWIEDSHTKRANNVSSQGRKTSITTPSTAWLGASLPKEHKSRYHQHPSYDHSPARSGLPPRLRSNSSKDFRSPLTGLHLLTSSEVIKSKKELSLSPTSPLSTGTSPTLINSPASQRNLRKTHDIIRTPTDDLNTAVINDIPDIRKSNHDDIILPKKTFNPSTARPPRSKSNNSRGSKSPKYVKSPLMGPERILQGSPRTVHIKTPSRGASIKTTASSRRDPDASDLDNLPRGDLTWTHHPKQERNETLAMQIKQRDVTTKHVNTVRNDRPFATGKTLGSASNTRPRVTDTSDLPQENTLWPQSQPRKKTNANRPAEMVTSRNQDMLDVQRSAAMNANARARHEKPLPPLPNAR